LRGFNAAYNARRQRVLEGQTPDQVVAERLTAKPALAKAKPSGRAGPDDIIKARLIAESAKEVSQPDSCGAVTSVLAIILPPLTWLGRDRLARLADQLRRTFIEAKHRTLRVDLFGVEIQYIFHSRNVVTR
jgi:hypothetical protein